MLEPQNFSIYANNEAEITIDIDPNEIDLSSAVMMFRVYEQALGLPSGDAIIEKDGDTTGSGITVLDADEKTIVVYIFKEDTVDLDPRNYYHETTVDDVTVAHGIMTILPTMNRSP